MKHFELVISIPFKSKASADRWLEKARAFFASLPDAKGEVQEWEVPRKGAA